ncbi:MAG: non-homologous end-joining DNA ligase [Acidobacteriota bacterium]|nr:non-homologous end-joining DNA ligase [Acidobacteriota bacterium]
MLLLRRERLQEGAAWMYEIKLDGYRAVAIKTEGKVALRSRNDKDFSARYPTIIKALSALPNETVVDGEVVAFDEEGRPSFNVLQNYGSSRGDICFYIFDLLVLAGRDVMCEPLEVRRGLLEERVLSKLHDPIRYSVELKAGLTDLIASIKAQQLEGLVAKKCGSAYESGLRSGTWQKMRINQGQELVIGGYTPSDRSFDALIIGYYESDRLLYAGRTRNGFTPALRLELMKRLRPLEDTHCPFANLPEKKSGRWGQGLTAAKMKDCHWLKPQLVGQFEFVEWTADLHLRHTRFIALRDDKKAQDVRRETR